MSKFEINFFYLEETNNRNEYKEELLNRSLKLSSIEDVKIFFESDFYNNIDDIGKKLIFILWRISFDSWRK